MQKILTPETLSILESLESFDEGMERTQMFSTPEWQTYAAGLIEEIRAACAGMDVAQGHVTDVADLNHAEINKSALTGLIAVGYLMGRKAGLAAQLTQQTGAVN